MDDEFPKPIKESEYRVEAHWFGYGGKFVSKEEAQKLAKEAADLEERLSKYQDYDW